MKTRTICASSSPKRRRHALPRARPRGTSHESNSHAGPRPPARRRCSGAPPSRAPVRGRSRIEERAPLAQAPAPGDYDQPSARPWPRSEPGPCRCQWRWCGLRRSGTLRTRSTCSRPSLRSAPLISTWSASWKRRRVRRDPADLAHGLAHRHRRYIWLGVDQRQLLRQSIKDTARLGTQLAEPVRRHLLIVDADCSTKRTIGPFSADFRCSRRKCLEMAWKVQSATETTKLRIAANLYRAPQNTTPSSAKTDPPAKTSAALASHEGLSSSLWVMIATLTTKSAHHPMIRSSVQAIGATCFGGQAWSRRRSGGGRRSRRLIRTCGGKFGHRNHYHGGRERTNSRRQTAGTGLSALRPRSISPAGWACRSRSTSSWCDAWRPDARVRVGATAAVSDRGREDDDAEPDAER